MLKKSLLAAAVAVVTLIAIGQATADVQVRGYYRSNGTYVRPHYRSTQDSNFYNNWSTKPNINSYTGRMGTRLTPPSSYYRNYYRYPSYGTYRFRYGW